MNSIIRWALLVPTTLASWFFIFFVGMVSYSFIFQCARTGFVYGTCILEEGQEIFMGIFAGLSALVPIIIAAAIAPAHKIKIAWATFFVGASLAAIINKPELYAAIISGFLSALVIGIYWRGRAPNTSSNRTSKSGAA